MVQDTSPFVCDIMLALNMPVTFQCCGLTMLCPCATTVCSKILLILDLGVTMRDCGFLLCWQMWF